MAVTYQFTTYRNPSGRWLFQLLESLAHCLDTGIDRTVHRGCIADDGTADGVHDEPDVGLHAADFDVGFRVRKSPMMCASYLRKRRDEAFFGRESDFTFFMRS